MRTTIDIDPRVAAAARARVDAGQSRSLGEAISQLALRGLQAAGERTRRSSGLVMLPTAHDVVITDSTVAEALADE